MDIVVTSDLHYGYDKNTDQIIRSFFNNIKPFEYLLIAGDIISHSQYQMQVLFSIIRDYHANAKIAIVRGNHDFWHSSKRASTDENKFNSIDEVLLWQTDVFKRYNVDTLEDKTFFIGDYEVIGWDGWYQLQPKSNDHRYMPFKDSAQMHEYMQKRSDKYLEIIRKKLKSETKKILMTHYNLYDYHSPIMEEYNMNGNLNLLAEFLGQVEYLIFGHSHIPLDITQKGTRIINSGSDYNKPKYLRLSL